MKKAYQVTIVSLTALCILVLSLALMLVGANVMKIIYSPKTDEEIFMEKLNGKTKIDFTKCSLVSIKDTHGGFSKTGTTQKIYNCYKESIDEDILKKKLISIPLSVNIKKDMEKTRYSYEGDLYTFGNIIKDITNGYYFFIDNNSINDDIGDIYTDKYLSTRTSINYTLGIYDADTKYFYFFEIDN